jgi:hypothetical protein
MVSLYFGNMYQGTLPNFDGTREQWKAQNAPKYGAKPPADEEVLMDKLASITAMDDMRPPPPPGAPFALGAPPGPGGIPFGAPPPPGAARGGEEEMNMKSVPLS